MGRHVPRATRQRILRRDNWTCQICGAQGVPLEIDHLNNTRGPGYDDDSNLMTKCRPCHRPKTKREGREGHARWRASGRYPTEQHPGLVR